MRRVLVAIMFMLSVVPMVHGQAINGTLSLSQQGVGCGPTFPAFTCRVPATMRFNDGHTTPVTITFQIFSGYAKASFNGIPATVMSYHWSSGEVTMEITGTSDLLGNGDDDQYDITFDTFYTMSRACARCNPVATVTGLAGTFSFID